jgi:hypothetical protein
VSVTGVPTTCQEFTLGDFSKTSGVTVLADVALYIAFDADGAVDGGAVAATARIPISQASAIAGVVFPLVSGGRRTGSIFVAAQSGTAAVTVEQE